MLKWLELVAGKKPQAESFERWIQDGTVVAKAMISISFNSVPLEVVNCNWGAVSHPLSHGKLMSSPRTLWELE